MATEQEFKSALIKADRAGDTVAANLFARKIREMQGISDLPVGPPVTESANNLDVPGVEGDPITSQAKPQERTRVIEDLIGVGETALTMATGATGGALGFVGGTIEGAAKELTGQIPRGEGLKIAQERASGLTFEPKTKVGKELTEFIGEKLSVLPPVIGSTPISSIGAAKPKGIPKSKARHIRGVLSDEIKAGNINAGNIAKTLDVDGSLINNPRTKAAIKLLGDDDAAYSTAINHEKMNKATRISYNKVLDVIEKNKLSGDPKQIVKNRPINIVGGLINKKVNLLNDKKVEASKKLGDIVKGDAGFKKIDVSQARDNFISALDDSDITTIKTDKGLQADTSRTLTNINEVIKDGRLNNVLSRLEGGNLTIKEAHKLKRNLRELVDFDQGAIGSVKVSDEISQTVKILASEINEQIGKSNKSYAIQNKIMSESMDALKKSDKLLGNTLMIGDDLAPVKFGSMSKRIATNLASKENVTDLLTSLDDALAKRGIVLKDDIERLVISIADLEKIFELESKQAPFGFQARVGQGALEAITTGTPTGALAKAAIDSAKKLNKLKFSDKIKALRMLSEIDKENK